MNTNDDMWKLIDEMYADILKFFMIYATDASYPEEDFKKNIMIFEESFQKLLEFLDKPENKEDASEYGEVFSELFYNFDKLKQTF